MELANALELNSNDALPASALPNVGALARVESAMPCSAPHWYAVYTNPRHERCVAQQIEQRSIVCFLPLYRTTRRWKDRRKELELALFPGYVFVHLVLEDRLRVLQLPGVVRLVSFQGRPAALPEAEIEALRRRLAAGGRVEPHPYLCAGRRVRVTAGPMQGLEGIIMRRKDRCRVVFSLDLIMRSMAVEVDESDLEPLPHRRAFAGGKFS
jgi:transcription antitermination factor NusG